jgi:cytochrome c-type biogenesis protein CcmE
MQQATLAKLAITSAVAVAGVGFLVYSSVAGAAHYKMVDELVTGGMDDWGDTELKVHGFVQRGSIIDTILDHEMQHAFILENKGKQIRVFVRGPVPDTFNDAAEVVATGHLLRPIQLQPRADQICRNKHGPACPIQLDAVALDATDVTAKCPEHYAKPSTPMPPPSWK